MKAIIFANGEYCPTKNPINIQVENLVIAADGGSSHCQTLGTKPDVLIGDLDSTSPNLIKDWQKAGVTVIRHPVRKDQTDLELGLFYAQEEGAREIEVYGAGGGRLDMSYGNLLLLAHKELTVDIKLLCGGEEVQVVREGNTVNLIGSPGDTVSLLSLQPGKSRITTKGLEYPLENENLAFGSTRGISNQLTAVQASIRLDSGLLAVIHTRTKNSQEK
ncbi:MAG: thiamine diphosphokinase [Anaerolineales bacterium]|nr:thiamine diphosphokinase [Anaerolineales bacterium]